MDKKGFTLVELIVVITILAILGTIAFLSFLGYTIKSRNSVRISDINNIEKALELYKIPTGFYPRPSIGVEITYSGSEVWTQGTIGDSVIQLLSKINKKPVDPLSGLEYTYSLLNTHHEFQIAAAIEGETSNNYINKTYAAVKKLATAYVKGTYNGLIAKVSSGATTYVLAVPTIISGDISLTDIITLQQNNKLVFNGYENLPSTYKNTTLEVDGGGFVYNPSSIVVYSGSITDLSENTQELVDFTLALQDIYASTDLKDNKTYEEIINLDSGDYNKINYYIGNIINDELNGKVKIPSKLTSKDIINKSTCESAGWYWVDNTNDVFIGTNRGNGYCISPRYGDWNSDSDGGNGGISFNGWGPNSSTYFSGWNIGSYKDLGLSSSNGQTRFLQGLDSFGNLSWYKCKPIGTAAGDYDSTDGKGDTIHNRMKWLAGNGNDYLESQNINWITGIQPVNGHPIPALYIADCIDGKRDIGHDITYTHNDNTQTKISYEEYNTDRLSGDQSSIYTGCSNTNIYSSDPDCIIYQNRSKYLLGWTQKRGSHLPSAYSYLENNTTSNTSKGEYQSACEQGIFGDGLDSSAGERIWTTALGTSGGDYWIYKARVIGRRSCSSTTYGYSGSRRGYQTARFIYRP